MQHSPLVLHYAVVERINENEAVKMIRFREGLRKLSTAYVTLGEKCQSIFTAYNTIASALPDVHDKDVTSMKFTGISFLYYVFILYRFVILRYLYEYFALWQC